MMHEMIQIIFFNGGHFGPLSWISDKHILTAVCAKYTMYHIRPKTNDNA